MAQRHKTVITILWDPKYVASTELEGIREQVEAVVYGHYFNPKDPEGIPMWAKLTSHSEEAEAEEPS